MSGAGAVAGRSGRRNPATLAALALLLLAVAVPALGMGAVRIPADRVLAALLAGLGADAGAAPGDTLVILQVRLPRFILSCSVGAALSLSGAVMQGLFRNPLADPGLVGVSAGAALAGGVAIVFGDAIFGPAFGGTPPGALPASAFLGGLIATLSLYRLSTREGRTSVATMLLAGIAIGALGQALMGLLAYLSNDRQLRDISFWLLGSLSGASWSKAGWTAAFVLPALLAVPFLGRGLNALSLGEAEAFHLGVPVQRMKIGCVVLVAITVGASVAAAGIVSFVGIIVPHTLRLIVGADHRLLLPASALLGGSLMTAADVLARTVVAPAEIPIGILTALIGAPFFLWLLLRRQGGALP